VGAAAGAAAAVVPGAAGGAPEPGHCPSISNTPPLTHNSSCPKMGCGCALPGGGGWPQPDRRVRGGWPPPLPPQSSQEWRLERTRTPQRSLRPPPGPPGPRGPCLRRGGECSVLAACGSVVGNVGQQEGPTAPHPTPPGPDTHTRSTLPTPPRGGEGGLEPPAAKAAAGGLCACCILARAPHLAGGSQQPNRREMKDSPKGEA